MLIGHSARATVDVDNVELMPLDDQQEVGQYPTGAMPGPLERYVSAICHDQVCQLDESGDLPKAFLPCFQDSCLAR